MDKMAVMVSSFFLAPDFAPSTFAVTYSDPQQVCGTLCRPLAAKRHAG